MLRKTMIVLAMAAALTGGLTADAFARGGGGGGGGGHGGGFGGGGFGGGGHMGGGFGGGQMGGGFSGGQMGGGFSGGHMGGGFSGGHMRGFSGARGVAGSHLAGTRGHFAHDRRFGRSRFGSYDFGCGYGYPYYNPYSCYLPTY